jgi:hypothetical protein
MSDRPRLNLEQGLMAAAAVHITPIFQGCAVDLTHARQMAISAIDAYEPESRADCVNAARTIAFSMAALSLLASATSQDMKMSEKMRAFGRANALNRSADQSERTMMQRRRYQRANPLADQPEDAAAQPSLLPEPDEAEINAAIEEAMRAYRAAASAAEPEPVPTSAQPQPPAPQPQPVAAPIQYSGPRLDVAQPRTASHKDTLLQHSALQRVVEQSDAQYSSLTMTAAKR